METKVTLAERRRRRKAGTLSELRFKIRRAGGQKMIEGAFIGGRTVFRRIGKDRLPIEALATIGIPQMFTAKKINLPVQAWINGELPADLGSRGPLLPVDHQMSDALDVVTAALLRAKKDELDRILATPSPRRAGSTLPANSPRQPSSASASANASALTPWLWSGRSRYRAIPCCYSTPMSASVGPRGAIGSRYARSLVDNMLIEINRLGSLLHLPMRVPKGSKSVLIPSSC